MAAQPPTPNTLTDAELLATLTGYGELPLEHIGLVDGMIYVWNRWQGCHFGMIIEDNRKWVECKQYLRRIGREFATCGEFPPK